MLRGALARVLEVDVTRVAVRHRVADDARGSLTIRCASEAAADQLTRVQQAVRDKAAEAGKAAAERAAAEAAVTAARAIADKEIAEAGRAAAEARAARDLAWIVAAHAACKVAMAPPAARPPSVRSAGRSIVSLAR